MEFFEIDLSSVVKSIGSSLVEDVKDIDIELVTEAGEENILRFHNNIKVFNSFIYWQGNTYFPAPIQAEGFDISARGTLPTPILRISAQKEEGIEALSILRRAIHKYGDINLKPKKMDTCHVTGLNCPKMRIGGVMRNAR